VAADPEVSADEIVAFLDRVVAYLGPELRTRLQRRDRFAELGLVGEDELERLLTARRDAQPWLIYMARVGGLGEYDRAAFDAQSQRGLAPCFRMPNHGVAWDRTGVDRYQMCLATGRQVGQDWDMDSDIGHESCHSAFSPVPLFTVPAGLPRDATPSLSSLASAREMSPRHLAGLCYMCSELVVVSVRGETRETNTGLPALENEHDFPAFLALSHELMPDLGFDRALEVFTASGGRIEPNHGDAIFAIAAPAIRALPFLRPEFNRFSTPSFEWFTRLRHGKSRPLPVEQSQLVETCA
jgi:hypothetical protein